MSNSELDDINIDKEIKDESAATVAASQAPDRSADATTPAVLANGDSDAKNADGRRWIRRAGVAGIVLAVVSWVAFFYHDTTAVCCSCLAVVLSLIGCFGRKRVFACALALTAALVIVIVYAIFYLLIPDLIDGL